ncbi:hypothetical protein MNBD_ALPHA09-1763 [hydrothermal vent metagenome]|uniref:Uncharacterized protein n=1 Tax=hydrothermal vent metagenome TaxID=652676 RepID=A0A3B0T5K0_9ZZZZ
MSGADLARHGTKWRRRNVNLPPLLPKLPAAAPLWGVVLVALTLAGCGTQDDFGRVNSSTLATRIGMAPYLLVPGYRDENAGRTALTPAETDLRRYANALTSGYAHQKTHGNYAQMVPIVPRKLRAALKSRTTAKYYVGEINRVGFKSGEAALNAITDDMRADERNIDGLWSAATKVYRADGIRIGEIDAGGIRPAVAGDILRRIEENRAIIDGVLKVAGERLEGYRMAISEAFVADPGSGYAGAKLEYVNLRRSVENLDSNLKGLGTRYALSLPRTDGCISQSLARAC